MIYLLDTSVFSQPLKRRPCRPALLRWKEVGDAACRVSRVTVAEVEWGLQYEDRVSRWKRYRAILENRIEVVSTDSDVWTVFSRLKARQRRVGEPVADLDLIIAATAAVHGYTLATLNRSDFKRVDGVAWEDWGRPD